MTQRVARPMKFAAFISIIISVAVMFAACQGAVGKAGEKGEKGEKGDPGETTAGLPGFTALQVKGVGPFVLINDVDGDDDDTIANEPGAAQTIDLTNYFRGGVEPYTYGTPTRIAAEEDITAAFDPAGSSMLKLSVAAQGMDELNDWEVVVTDADGSTVKITVNARRNNPPTAPAAAEVIVGTQAPATVPATTPACPDADECVATIVFTDDEPMEMLTFTGDSADKAKVVVVSSTTEANVMAEVVLRGIASTWVADTRTAPVANEPATPGHKPVPVTVTAVDRGLLPVKATLNVTVDGAPTVAEALPSYAFTATYTSDKITNLDDFFEDPEGENLADWVVGEDDANVVVTSGVAFVSVAVTGDELTITRKAAGGSAEITITATEAVGDGPEQTVTGVIRVTTS